MAVYDLDGEDRRESTLIADREFSSAQLDGKIELHGEALGEPSLELLRLEVDDAPRPQHLTRAMSVNAGLVALDELDIPAGMLVEIRAAALQVVAIDLEQGDDAQVIFETLNARGEPLLPADLLRQALDRDGQTLRYRRRGARLARAPGPGLSPHPAAPGG